MFLSEWREFPSAPCLAGEKKNLLTARVSMLLKSRASPDMLPFSLCNKKRLAIWHMNRPLFPTTLSILSYDNGKYFGLRTYQYPLISIKYSEYVSVTKVVHHEKRLRRFILPSVASLSVTYFFTLSINGTIFGRKLLNIKNVFSSETFLVLTRIQRDCIDAYSF